MKFLLILLLFIFSCDDDDKSPTGPGGSSGSCSAFVNYDWTTDSWASTSECDEYNASGEPTDGYTNYDFNTGTIIVTSYYNINGYIYNSTTEGYYSCNGDEYTWCYSGVTSNGEYSSIDCDYADCNSDGESCVTHSITYSGNNATMIFEDTVNGCEIVSTTYLSKIN